MPIDLEKLTFIDAKDVPYVRKGSEPCEDWEKIFSMIPVGKALHIEGSQRKAGKVITALGRLQKRGKFQRLRCTRRQGDSYVINPKGES